MNFADAALLDSAGLTGIIKSMNAIVYKDTAKRKEHKTMSFYNMQETNRRVANVKKILKEKGLDAEKAKQICVALLLYAHGMAAMQATGRTAFTRQQIEANMHAMHEMLLARVK